MRGERPLRRVSEATVITFLQNLNAIKTSGDPRYSFQTKTFLAGVGGFTSPVLDVILADLTESYGGSTVHRIASEIGYEVKVPGARQYLTVREIERAWERDNYYEDRARANVAYDRDPETGELFVVHFPGDDGQ